jgi:hypothetical protein
MDQIILDKKECTYSYFADPMYAFMDAEYNQFEVEAENMGDAINYLEDGMTVEVVFYDGKAISVELPTTVVREIQTDPAVKGDTSGKVLKPAKLVGTGFEISVPIFVENGDKIEIDTRTTPSASDTRSASDSTMAFDFGWRVDATGEVGHCGTVSSPEVGDCLRAIAADWRQPALLALAFQEDFAIVDGSNATLPWLAVALPSHWAPEAKVGRYFAEVHAPVADNRLLLAAGEHLMRLVTQADRWQRFVWQITPHRDLHHHPSHSPARHWPQDASAEAVAARAWFRTERQTFIPVPSVRQAIFTIQVDNQPLTEAVTDPAHAALLHAALESMSPAVLAYRDLAGVRDALLAWLAARKALPGLV